MASDRLTHFRRLPGVLLIEAGLALAVASTVVVPFAVGTYTPIRTPPLWTPVAGFGVLLLAALWLLLLLHALAAVWRLAGGRTDLASADRRDVVHAVFRVLETVGAMAPVYLVYHFGRRFGRALETPHGPAGVGALFVVVGAMVATAVVVLLHAGWLLVDGDSTG